MVLQLSSIKMAWSFSRTKRFRAPTSEYARNNTMYQKYLARPDDLSALSLLEWLRCMNKSSKTPKPYKNGSTLVGVQTVSLYSDEYFFQHLLLNHLHRHLSDLRHRDHEILPHVIKFFSSAVSLQPSLWTNIRAVADKLEMMGNKDSYVATATCHVSSLHDTLNLWRLRGLTSDALVSLPTGKNTTFPIDAKQLAILQHMKSAVKGRKEYYELYCTEDDDSPSYNNFIHTFVAN